MKIKIRAAANWWSQILAVTHIRDINHYTQSIAHTKKIGDNRRRAMAHGSACPVCGEHHMYMGHNGHVKESSWLVEWLIRSDECPRAGQNVQEALGMHQVHQLEALVGKLQAQTSTPKQAECKVKVRCKSDKAHRGNNKHDQTGRNAHKNRKPTNKTTSQA